MLGGVAFASFTADDKSVTLHQLYVRPGLQGQGIGSLLLDEIESCFPDADKAAARGGGGEREGRRLLPAAGICQGRPDRGLRAGGLGHSGGDL
jgi:GNAT superfamily N-acetyltransferase